MEASLSEKHRPFLERHENHFLQTPLTPNIN